MSWLALGGAALVQLIAGVVRARAWWHIVRQTREAWSNRARALETVGATGINSCSPVGPGGFTGCLVQVVKQARQETNESVQQNTAPEE